MTQLGLDATFRARLIDILKSDACRRIDFTWAGEHIGGTGFAYLAIALLSPHTGQSGIAIKLFERPPRGVGAQYSSNFNTLVVSSYDYGKLHKEQMLLVHEMTHAHIDEFGVGPSTTTIDHEICAYAAGALFNVFSCTTPAIGPYLWNPGAATHPVWKEAYAVARIIASKAGAGRANLSTHDVARLRALILHDRVYRRAAHRAHANSGVAL